MLALVVSLPAPAARAADNAQALLQQGDRYLRDGKLQEARAAYEQAIEAGAKLESDARHARSLGYVYLYGEPRDPETALRWLDLSWKAQPSESTRSLLAEAFLRTGNYAAALDHYNGLVQTDPTSQTYAIGLARALEKSDRRDAALLHLEGFLKEHPDRNAARLEYGDLLASAKHYDDARAQYQEVLSRDPESVTAEVSLARVASYQKDWDTALSTYDKVLASRPDYYDAVVGKGFALLWMGRRAEAREMLTQAAQRKPDDSEVARALDLIERAEQRDAERLAEQQRRDAIRAHLQQAREATSERNYTQAIHHYHQVLELDPGNSDAMLQIARVLAWSKAYDDSLAQYDAVLAKNPDNVRARREKARVLGWARDFPAAINEYQSVLAALEGSREQADRADLPRIRLEYAQMLSYAGRDDEALQQLDLVVPPGHQPGPGDEDAYIVRGRVLAYQHRYPEAIEAYDQALVAAPGDPDARLGKARVLYWNGSHGEARPILANLQHEQPDSAEVVFLLATLERSTGRNARALHLLDSVRQTSDTERLRSSILDSMRPELRFRFGYGDDRESTPVAFGSGLVQTTIRALRYTASIEFNIHPDVRLRVRNTVAQGSSSSGFVTQHGQPSYATETMADISFRVTRGLDMNLGAGVGTTGGAYDGGDAPRKQHFLYSVRPVITKGDWRFDFGSSRSVADYNPLTVHDNVVVRRESASLSYWWNRLVRFSTGFYRNTYSVDCPTLCRADLPGVTQREFETAANGGDVRVMGAVVNAERVKLEMGAEYEVYGFEDSAKEIEDLIGSAGFFTPSLHQQYGPVARFTWDPHPHARVIVEGSGGAKRNLRFDGSPRRFQPTASLHTELNLHWTDFELNLRYGFSDSDTSGFLGSVIGIRDGKYRVHSAGVELVYRF